MPGLTTAPVGWIGWLRVNRGPWRSVVGETTRDDCLALLLHHADTVAGAHKDLLILEAGRHPNDPPCRRGRVGPVLEKVP
jgi:hypothetical protein